MASKLAAAKIAAWSGVRAVIAQADRDDVLVDAVAGGAGVGTMVVPAAGACRPASCGSPSRSARPARCSSTRAKRALLERGVSLLPAGVTGVKGSFEADEAVEIADPDGAVFAKGLCRLDAAGLREVAGLRTFDLPRGSPTRSSTATISSSCRDRPRSGGFGTVPTVDRGRSR